MIRPLTPTDIPHIPRLLATEQGPSTEPPPLVRAVIENLMPRLFLDTPHADPEIPGLVSVGDDGQLTGMIGRVPRRMEFRGVPIRAAVACELFVDPAHRSKMLGVKLLKQAMAGPQDLLFSDIANDTSRKIWTGLGGSIASWYGLAWVKVLQPAQFALSMLRSRPGGKLLWSARPVAAIADRVTRSLANSYTRLGPAPNAVGDELTSELFLELFPRFSEEDELRPMYDRETVDWLWSRLNFMHAAGPSEQRLVRSPRGEPLGWYVYQMTDTRIIRVSQIVAFPKTIGLVLDHLLHEANRNGAIAVSGRIVPRFLQAFMDRNCFIRPRSTYTLIHARDPQLLEAFTSGRAFLSLFESEGPIQLWINPAQAVKQSQAEIGVEAQSRSNGVLVESKQSNPATHAASVLRR